MTSDMSTLLDRDSVQKKYFCRLSILPKLKAYLLVTIRYICPFSNVILVPPSFRTITCTFRRLLYSNQQILTGSDTEAAIDRAKSHYIVHRLPAHSSYQTSGNPLYSTRVCAFKCYVHGTCRGIDT